MISKVKLLVRQVQYAWIMSKETEYSFFGSLAKMKAECEEFKITPKQYVSNRFWELPSDLKKILRTNPYIEVVAKEKEVRKIVAFFIMNSIKEKYGISFSEFAHNKLYVYRTQEKLDKQAAKIVKKERGYISHVSRVTGWTHEDSERRMIEVKEKFPTISFRKFAGYGFYENTDEEIRTCVKRWTADSRKIQDRAMAETGWSRKKVRNHIVRVNIVHGLIPAYYNCYKAWELSEEQLKSYAHQGLSYQISNRCNGKSAIAKLNNKDRFNEIFAEFANRKHWVNSESTFEDFLAFAEGIDGAFCKPLKSGGGLGVFTLDLGGSETELRKIYDDIMSKPLILVEELVKQHPSIDEFYPHSVNTIRVITILDDRGVKILAAGIRFGQEGIVDNFSAGGMVADVDISTGEVVTDAIDKKGDVHVAHPYSGKVFKGFKIPNWDLVIDYAKRGMYVLDDLNYVGWDFAICEDKVCVIEGNSGPDLVLVQAPYAPSKIGKRYLFESYLKAKESV